MKTLSEKIEQKLYEGRILDWLKNQKNFLINKFKLSSKMFEVISNLVISGLLIQSTSLDALESIVKKMGIEFSPEEILNLFHAIDVIRLNTAHFI